MLWEYREFAVCQTDEFLDHAESTISNKQRVKKCLQSFNDSVPEWTVIWKVD